MIRYAVYTVLMFYFAGAEIMQPIMPPFIDVSTQAFHQGINRTMRGIVGPVVDAAMSPFGSEQPTPAPAVRGTIPPDQDQ